MAERIGIIGDGQLGRMLTEAAKPMGFAVTALGETNNSPAQQAGADHIKESLKSAEALRELASRTGVMTYEIEHIAVDPLLELVADGHAIEPSPETLRMIQDKLTQKQFLRSHGIPVSDFEEVRDRKDLLDIAGAFGWPFVIKTRHGGYDGRGNAVVRSKYEIDVALQQFGDRPVYAERFVPYDKELAVVAARSMTGDIATYPVVQTIHENSICETVLAPAPIPKATYDQALDVAGSTMQLLQGAGVFGIEMFMSPDGQIVINEIAPRVHNSGHLTIEACVTSQFQQHIRAITGMQLGDPGMVVKAAVMKNILGDRNGQAALSGREMLGPNVGLHIYGKEQTRPQRKMGHLTVVGENLETVLQQAQLARSYLSI